MTYDDIAGLAASRPWVALGLSICMLSLLGFPGTFGFIGKWYIISAVIAEGQVILPVVLVVTSVISAGYYLPVIMAMYMKSAPDEELHRAVRLCPSAARWSSPVSVAACWSSASGRGERSTPRCKSAGNADPDRRPGRPGSKRQPASSRNRMNVPKSIFRQYDVRGLVDRELTPDFARALGRAFASVATDRLGRAPVIAVGRDNRPSGPALSQGVRAGIAEAGGTAIDVGTLPTPALYFAVSALGTDGGLQVTGSHNPPEFNGFKMVLAGEAFHGDDILELWEIIMAERWRSGRARKPPTARCSSAIARGSSAGTSSSARCAWWWTAATAWGA